VQVESDAVVQVSGLVQCETPVQGRQMLGPEGSCELSSQYPLSQEVQEELPADEQVSAEVQWSTGVQDGH
jgi:hypothetical protein